MYADDSGNMELKLGEKIIDLRKQIPVMLVVNELIDSAHLDLEAAKVLYSAGNYSNCVFHLQQAMEKAVKAYFLYLGDADKEDLTKIGHQTTIAYLEHLRDIYRRQTGLMGDAQYAVSEATLRRVDALLPHEQGKRGKKRLKPKIVDELLNLSKEKILSGLLQVKSSIDTIEFNLRPARDKVEQIKSDFIKIFPLGSGLVEEMANRAPRYQSNWGLLYFLSTILNEHYTTTRYPGGKLEPSDYKRGLGVVDATPELIAELEQVIAYLRQDL